MFRIESLKFLRIVFITCLFIITSQSKGQVKSFIYEKVKAEYIFSFGQFIDWENNDKSFHIGLMAADSSLTKSLRWISKWRKVKKKSIEIIIINNTQEIDQYKENLNIIYIGVNKCEEAKNIIDLSIENNILLVTDSCNNSKNSMLNFTQGPILRVETNEQNISKAGFTIPVFLLSLGEKYEKDWEELYRKTDSLLADQQKLVELKQLKLNERIHEIELKQKEIETLNQ
ncbi:MAG: hypothetical protein C0594_15355, partial [Marinilabiliales bacterium]